MGYGDEVMATGLARAPASRGKRAAFGNGKQLIWGPWCEEVFRHNPHIVRPGEEQMPDVEWVAHYKGHRAYNRQSDDRSCWEWNYSFKAVPGQMFFTPQEMEYATAVRTRIGKDFIVMEPNVPWQKSVAQNKDWGFKNYQEVADRLQKADRKVVQFSHGRDRLLNVEMINTPSFRAAVALLQLAQFAVLPEGGLHHGAAAVGTRAVVIFGGFIPPQVTGYDTHINLTGGAEEACGKLTSCLHCRRAMMNISPDMVYAHVMANTIREEECTWPPKDLLGKKNV